MTLVKVFPKFECNIYSDIDFQSAISVSSTGNSRSFIVPTDRLAFVNFSSPGIYHGCMVSIEKSVTWDHCLASQGKPRDADQWPS